MNRYGRPNHVGGASSTKASTNTVCQKCLKKGHYSFDCKAPAQERPYISRPSRSQQLLNPKLKPKLANVALEPLIQEKTVAPSRAKDADQRLRKRSLDDMNDYPVSRKRTRSRSVSSYSSDSVATISTRSPSPETHRRRDSPDRYSTSQRSDMDAPSRAAGDKRRRRPSSISPPEELATHDSRDRNTRMRRSSTSPVQRGRRRSRSVTSERRIKSRSANNGNGNGNGNGNSLMDKTRRTDPDDRPRVRADRNHNNYNHSRDGLHNNDREMKDAPPTESRPRSLSPYSKRIALTQGINR